MCHGYGRYGMICTAHDLSFSGRSTKWRPWVTHTSPGRWKKTPDPFGGKKPGEMRVPISSWLRATHTRWAPSSYKLEFETLINGFRNGNLDGIWGYKL